MIEGNGTHPGAAAVCANHDAAIANLEESRHVHSARFRDLDDRVSAQDGVLGQVLAALAESRVASDKAAAQSAATLQRVQELATDWRRIVDSLSVRVARLESPSRPAMPSHLDEVSDDTAANAIDPGAVLLLRKINDEREARHTVETELAAVRAELSVRARHSERVAATEKSEAAERVAQMEARIRLLKVVAGVAVTALATLGSIAAAYFAARGG